MDTKKTIKVARQWTMQVVYFSKHKSQYLNKLDTDNGTLNPYICKRELFSLTSIKSNQYCENWEHMGRVEHRAKSEGS